MMVILNVFWAQHGSKITIVSNLAYFAVQTPAFFSVQSYLLCRHHTIVVSQLTYSATQISANCSVQTHLLSCADTRLLYGANFAGLLYMAQTRRSLQVSVS